MLLVQNQYQKNKVFLWTYLKKQKIIKALSFLGEIFSSETINNDPISKEEIKKDNDKTKLDGTKNNKKILANIYNNPLDETQSFQKEIESSIDKDLYLEMKDENKDIIEYFETKKTKKS